MHKTIYPLAAAVAFSLAGCATIFTGTTETISINTEPPGAKVEFSHGGTCITPCNESVKKKGDIQLTIRKEGCRTHTTTMISTLGTMGGVSPMLTLTGGLIDYSTGAVYEHKPNPLFVHLDCEPPAASASGSEE